jgi:hypothetical protein
MQILGVKDIEAAEKKAKKKGHFNPVEGDCLATQAEGRDLRRADFCARATGRGVRREQQEDGR